MVIHQTGQAIITLRLANQFDNGQYGDDGTVESVTDTDLISPIASSDLPLIRLVSGNSMQFIHELDEFTSNGETLREFTLKIDGDSVNRVTIFESEKNDTTEISTVTIWAVKYN